MARFFMKGSLPNFILLFTPLSPAFPFHPSRPLTVSPVSPISHCSHHWQHLTLQSGLKQRVEQAGSGKRGGEESDESEDEDDEEETDEDGADSPLHPDDACLAIEGAVVLSECLGRRREIAAILFASHFVSRFIVVSPLPFNILHPIPFSLLLATDNNRCCGQQHLSLWMLNSTTR
ncbi:unnamed protein product [Closterium sp. NIES-53]